LRDSQTLASLIEQAGRGSPADGAALAFSIVAVRNPRNQRYQYCSDIGYTVAVQSVTRAAVYALVRSVAGRLHPTTCAELC